MKALLKQLWSDESGQAMVEYGMVIAVVAVLAVAVLTAFWGDIQGMFDTIGNDLQAAPGNVTPGG
jgi:pilus assembly protein Flp/PilA